MSVVAPFFLTSIQKQLVRDSFESIGEYSDSVVILFLRQTLRTGTASPRPVQNRN